MFKKLKDYSLFNAKKELLAIEFFSAFHIIQASTLQINIEAHLRRNNISWYIWQNTLYHCKEVMLQ